MEIRELLKEYKFDGDEIPIIRGSAVSGVMNVVSYSCGPNETQNPSSVC